MVQLLMFNVMEPSHDQGLVVVHPDVLHVMREDLHVFGLLRAKYRLHFLNANWTWTF